MKNKFLKISSLILSLGMLVCSFSNAFAGVGASRPKKTPESHKRLPPMSVDLKRAIDIWANQLKYSPMYAEDGGKAYFWSWNGVKCKEDFDAFVKNIKRLQITQRVLNHYPILSEMKIGRLSLVTETHTLWNRLKKAKIPAFQNTCCE